MKTRIMKFIASFQNCDQFTRLKERNSKSVKFSSISMRRQNCQLNCGNSLMSHCLARAPATSRVCQISPKRYCRREKKKKIQFNFLYCCSLHWSYVGKKNVFFPLVITYCTTCVSCCRTFSPSNFTRRKRGEWKQRVWFKRFHYMRNPRKKISFHFFLWRQWKWNEWRKN